MTHMVDEGKWVLAGATLITPDQCRSARGFLGWSVADLAKKAGVGRNTVVRLEQGSDRTQLNNLQAIRRAFELEGIVFEVTSEGSQRVTFTRRRQ
jgi:transcriptional regulator with XRE-family HTH domain